MIGLLMVSIISGAIISGVTGFGFLFWIASAFFFVCGLPALIMMDYYHGGDESPQEPD